MIAAADVVLSDPPVLTFDSEAHKYFVEGREVVGVTKSLQIAKILDYSGIPRHILDHAAERGRNVHTMLELFDLGTLDPISVSGEYLGFLNAYKSFIADTGFQCGSIEVRRYHASRHYAGTFDRTGLIGGQLIRLDFKTGAFQEGYFVQLSGGYGNLFRSPRRFRDIVLEVKPNGTYKVHECPPTKFEYYTSLMFSAVCCAQFCLQEGRY